VSDCVHCVWKKRAKRSNFPLKKKIHPLMTNSYVLNTIPCRIPSERLWERTHIEPDSDYGVEIQPMVEEALAIAEPKGFYTVELVEPGEYDAVHIQGVEFKSRVLRVNLESVHRVFPFVVTCGTELDEWSNGFDDILQKFWADTIKEVVLESANEYLTEHLEERFQTGSLASMNPGSLEDWPISEQKKLFALLGDTRTTIGVTLTETYLMIPTKSVSGIYFPTEEGFESCRLCPRDPCHGRRAPYDEELYENKYR